MNRNISQYLSEKFSYDIKAGITVFLVAVPLCLGIALASGVPAISGLIAGIVGGIIVGLLSGSALSVSGCAAGLVPVVLLAKQNLGTVDLLFAAVMLSGCYQYVFGFLRAGIVAQYIPSSVIKGMLAAIGIIIIIKQVPHLFGYDDTFDEAFSLINSYREYTDHFVFGKVISFFDKLTVMAILVSVVSFAILYLYSSNLSKDNKYIKFFTNYVPGSLIVIIVAALFNNLCFKYFPDFALTNKHLVNVPDINLSWNPTNLFAFNFDVFKNILLYKYALIIAVIGSLETLLSIEAGDKLDPQKRVTPTARELKAQGVGNIVSGLLGGLPVTSVVIRTSVNIENDAKTKMATIIHGIFLLLSLFFVASLINQIPLASLACILVVTGYKLTHEKLIIEMFNRGAYEFWPFIATIIAILLTDLLIGVLIGLGVSILLILKNYYTLHSFSIIKNLDSKELTIKFSEYTTFLSKSKIEKLLQDVPAGAIVILDFSRSIIVDHEIREVIKHYVPFAKANNVELLMTPNFTNTISFSGFHIKHT